MQPSNREHPVTPDVSLVLEGGLQLVVLQMLMDVMANGVGGRLGT